MPDLPGPADVDQVLADATIAQLLAACGPAPIQDGGTCPTGCGHDAWPIDTIQWTCDTGHRGTLPGLRAHVAGRPDLLARLLGQPRLAGQPLHQPTRELPAVTDDWATPADLFAAFTRHDLPYDDQLDWLRLFVTAHGQDLTLELLEAVDQPTAAIIDARQALRPAPHEAAA